MNRIFITDDEKQTIMDVNKNVFKGCTFYNDGRVERITKKTFDIFKNFILSKDQTRLPNEGKYEVILDNKSGLEHYFLDKKEDFEMLFYNNGSSAIECDEDKENVEPKKKSLISRIGNRLFKFGKTIVSVSVAGLTLGLLIVTVMNWTYLLSNKDGLQKFNDLHLPTIKKVQIVTLDSVQRYLRENVKESEPIERVEEPEEIELPVNIEDITIEEVIDGIYNKSPELSQEEKDLLFNKDFFEDLLSYVNSSNASKILFRERFNNIIIKVDDNIRDGVAGRYNPSNPNVIWVCREALEDPEWYFDIIVHELIHMAQNCDYYYNVITEACAEILSSEYYGYKESTYSEEVYLVKKLMEIIGVEPIIEYLYTGSFNGISEGLRLYLNDVEYNSVLETLHQTNNYDANHSVLANHISHEICDLYLDFAFKRKYGVWPNEDLVMRHLKDKDLVRYYFNARKNKKEGSYTYQAMDSHMRLEDAMKNEVLSITTVDDDGKTKELTYEDFVSYRHHNRIRFNCNIANRTFNVYYGKDAWEVEINDYGLHSPAKVKIELPLPGERQIVNELEDEQEEQNTL